uniref:Transmembrane protein 106A n=1 Tax=Sus scrofa TaxID=9823 RepID=A0A8D1TJT4_PIG
MGETFSQLGSQKDENKSILPPDPTIGSKSASYSSTNSSKVFCSCVPCERATGASFVICPTCQGSGEIPRELEKQLVALIPYGDQRLKPRHTKLSVFLAVFICLVTSSLIAFFLFPRTIAMQPAGLNSSTVAFEETDICLNITNILNISNNNYYPITVTQLTVEVLHLSLVVGQVSDSLLLHIGPLASEQVTSSPWPALPTGVWMRVVVGRWQLELVAHLTPIWLTGILCSSQQDTGRKHIQNLHLVENQSPPCAFAHPVSRA